MTGNRPCELGVGYVLEGSVRKTSDKIRINTQLVDATTGTRIWAQRFDRDLADVFAMQDEVTGIIVNALLPISSRHSRIIQSMNEAVPRMWRLYTSTARQPVISENDRRFRVSHGGAPTAGSSAVLASPIRSAERPGAVTRSRGLCEKHRDQPIA